MDSDIHHHHHHNQHLQQNMNSGLTRYRSAPSSYLSNLINSSGMYAEEELVSDFFISGGDSSRQNLDQIGGNEFMVSRQSQQMMMMYQNHQEFVPNNSSAMVDRLRTMDPPTNLLRQSSSPAGFFEHNNIIDNCYHIMDNFQPANGSVPDSSFSSSASRSSSRYERKIYGGFWDETSMLTDGFLNGFAENDRISSSENQEKVNDEGRIHGLTHQLSLPTELSGKEKLVQFETDIVPLRSRAKRGCATHPRSIAERVRRTRISERIRKLQDLVPNMDKQTSTADMLDLAVDYIKQLQNQVETLSDRRTKCTCHIKLKP